MGDFLCLFQNKKFLQETDSLEILRSSLKDLNQLQKNILNTLELVNRLKDQTEI